MVICNPDQSYNTEILKIEDDYENNIEGEVKPYIDRHEQIIKDSFPQYYDLLKPLYYASK